jgi:beta-glucosidase-like glycosyl hydrolase
MVKKAVIGINSTTLLLEEIELLKTHKPYGVILFKRNCQDEYQLKNLTSSIKNIYPDIKIFIDQEGGSVARLRKPNFIEFPPAAILATKEQVYENYFNMGQYISSFAIDINCAPVADLYFANADIVIGNRSFGSDVKRVVSFAQSAAQGLLDSKVTPVIKHIPGHGRAMVDSHLALPTITTSLDVLEETDFKVFHQLNYLPMAMTAHITYNALDENFPVSTSKKAINYIRNNIGFKGVIISDDINMKALQGNIADIAIQVIDAGCDLVLHCNANIEEMKLILESI